MEDIRAQSRINYPKLFRMNIMNNQLKPIILFVTLITIYLIPPSQSTPQSASPITWMTQVAALSGHTPKMSKAPLVQLDTGSKYYKTMIDGMMLNFKRAVNKASEKAYSRSNVTNAIQNINLVGPVSTEGGNNNNGQATNLRVSVQDLQIEGLTKPKVSNVYVSKKNMKLHVIFNYKTVKILGKCSHTSSQQKPSGLDKIQSSKVLLEATNWNSSWSANVMPMVGREHFDMSKVYSSHSQQKLSFNLKDCPSVMHERLKSTLLNRLKTAVDNRLVEIMETVILQVDPQNEDFLSNAARVSKEKVNKERSKRDSTPGQKLVAAAAKPVAKATVHSVARKVVKEARETVGKVLKRNKRQTPCQEGDELDDYVDQLFRFGTRIVRAMEPITLPNATIELPDYNLKIFLYEGRGTRAYKFKRTKGAWVFCSNETISLGLTIEVEELRVAYKYRVISGNRLLFDGDLEAKLSPKVQAQFSQAVQEEDSEEPVQQRVDRIRVFRLGRVHVVIRGLGNLTQSLSMLINSYLNDNQEELQPTFRMVEGDAVRMINKMLANVNVPLLSVV